MALADKARNRQAASKAAAPKKRGTLRAATKQRKKSTAPGGGEKPIPTQAPPPGNIPPMETPRQAVKFKYLQKFASIPSLRKKAP